MSGYHRLLPVHSDPFPAPTDPREKASLENLSAKSAVEFFQDRLDLEYQLLRVCQELLEGYGGRPSCRAAVEEVALSLSSGRRRIAVLTEALASGREPHPSSWQLAGSHNNNNNKTSRSSVGEMMDGHLDGGEEDGEGPGLFPIKDEQFNGATSTSYSRPVSVSKVTDTETGKVFYRVELVKDHCSRPVLHSLEEFVSLRERLQASVAAAAGGAGAGGSLSLPELKQLASMTVSEEEEEEEGERKERGGGDQELLRECEMLSDFLSDAIENTELEQNPHLHSFLYSPISSSPSPLQAAAKTESSSEDEWFDVPETEGVKDNTPADSEAETRNDSSTGTAVAALANDSGQCPVEVSTKEPESLPSTLEAIQQNGAIENEAAFMSDYVREEVPTLPGSEKSEPNTVTAEQTNDQCLKLPTLASDAADTTHSSAHRAASDEIAPETEFDQTPKGNTTPATFEEEDALAQQLAEDFKMNDTEQPDHGFTTSEMHNTEQLDELSVKKLCIELSGEGTSDVELDSKRDTASVEQLDQLPASSATEEVSFSTSAELIDNDLSNDNASEKLAIENHVTTSVEPSVEQHDDSSVNEDSINLAEPSVELSNTMLDELSKGCDAVSTEYSVIKSENNGISLEDHKEPPGNGVATSAEQNTDEHCDGSDQLEEQSGDHATFQVDCNSDKIVQDTPVKRPEQDATVEERLEKNSTSVDNLEQDAMPVETLEQNDLEQTASEKLEPDAASEKLEPDAASEKLEPDAASEKLEPDAASEKLEPDAGSEKLEPDAGSEKLEPDAGSEEKLEQDSKSEEKLEQDAKSDQDATSIEKDAISEEKLDQDDIPEKLEHDSIPDEGTLLEEKQDQGATSVEKLEQDGFQSDKQLDQDATCASEGELDQDAESGEKLDQDAESGEKLDQDAESGEKLEEKPDQLEGAVAVQDAATDEKLDQDSESEGRLDWSEEKLDQGAVAVQDAATDEKLEQDARSEEKLEQDDTSEEKLEQDATSDQHATSAEKLNHGGTAAEQLEEPVEKGDQDATELDDTLAQSFQGTEKDTAAIEKLDKDAEKLVATKELKEESVSGKTMNQDIIVAEKLEHTTESEGITVLEMVNQDATELQDDKAVKKLEQSDTTVKPEEDDITVKPEEDDTTVKPEEDDTTVKPEEDDTTVKPEEDDTTVKHEEEVKPEEDDTTVKHEEEVEPEEDDTTVKHEEEVEPEEDDTTVKHEEEVKPEEDDTTVKHQEEVEPEEDDTTVKHEEEVEPEEDDATVKHEEKVKPEEDDTTVKHEEEVEPEEDDTTVKHEEEVEPEEAVKKLEEDTTVKKLEVDDTTVKKLEDDDTAVEKVEGDPTIEQDTAPEEDTVEKVEEDAKKLEQSEVQDDISALEDSGKAAEKEAPDRVSPIISRHSSEKVHRQSSLRAIRKLSSKLRFRTQHRTGHQLATVISSQQQVIPTQEWDPTCLLEELYSDHRKALPVQSAKSGESARQYGYMQKLPINQAKSTLTKGWKRRYFRAMQGNLFYYEDRTSPKALGFVRLEDCRIICNPAKLDIRVTEKSGRYLMMKLYSPSELNEWHRALQLEATHPTVTSSLTPKMQSDRSVVIIDIGACSVRAGFACKNAYPQLFFPAVASMSTDRHSSKFFCGMEALLPRNRMHSTLVYPRRHIQRMDKHNSNIQSMKIIIETVLAELGVDPEGCHLLLTMPATVPEHEQHELAEVLLEHIGVSAIYFQEQAVLALYSYNTTSGIIVDIGDHIDIIPIIDGFKLEAGISRMPFGGNAITEKLSKIITEKGIRYFSETESYITRFVKEQLCYMSQDYSADIENCSDNPAAYTRAENVDRFQLPDHRKVVSLTDSLFQAPEGLFSPLMWGKDVVGLHELVWKAIQSCPLDSRREMCQNVYLSGGSGCLPGLKERLESELSSFSPHGITIQVHRSDSCHHAAYIGASVLAMLSSFEMNLITQEEWATSGPASFSKFS